MNKKLLYREVPDLTLFRTITTGQGDSVSFELHSHSSYEIFILKSEKATFFAEGTIYPMQKDDVIIFNNKELHNISFDNTQPYERVVINFNPIITLPYDTEKYKILSTFHSRKNGKNNYIPREMLEKTAFYEILEKMLTVVASSEAYSDIYLQTLFIQLLIEMNNASSLSEIKDYPRLSNEKTRKILSYINDHLTEDLSLEYVAEEFHISKSNLCHLFKTVTGFSVKQYVTYRRIALAQKFLSEGYSTLEASVAAGFNDYSNFYKTFKKFMGKPPIKFK